jgi:hypothetical protein
MDNVKLKFFTLNEANSLIPEIESTVAQVQFIQEKLAINLTEVGRMKMKNRRNGNRAAFLERMEEIGHLQKDLVETHSFLQEKGLVVRDYEAGIIDFPTIIAGDLGYFCWKAGESRVSHWHSVGEGSRKPITDDLPLFHFENGQN